MLRFKIAIAGRVVLMLLGESPLAHAQLLRTVALSGQPGTAPFSSAGNFGIPALNNHGQVAFQTQLTGPGVTALNGYGIWSEGGGNGLQLVAHSGTITAGVADDIRYSRFDDPFLSDSSILVFRADIFPSAM